MGRTVGLRPRDSRTGPEPRHPLSGTPAGAENIRRKWYSDVIAIRAGSDTSIR